MGQSDFPTPARAALWCSSPIPGAGQREDRCRSAHWLGPCPAECGGAGWSAAPPITRQGRGCAPLSGVAARGGAAVGLRARMLASFKLPAYEEVAHRPSTPPPPYSAILAQLSGPRGRLGSSSLTLSPSSENYTSCSCESSCATSPSSTSLSVQVTDETERSRASTPSEEGGTSSTGTGASWDLPPEEAPARGAPHKHALFSSTVDFFEADCHPCSDIEEGEEEEGGAAQEEGGSGGEHFRHRRLTGDSGIEVGRCQEEEEGEGEGTHLLGKGAAAAGGPVPTPSRPGAAVPWALGPVPLPGGGGPSPPGARRFT
ncbi:PREDICTED: WW domain-binding protein 1 [Haliaeetus leucocephalus]|uniref:WW domain-binding protein 1 n=1 Tax=Haliaeetus leucocephalus TaxID=52644 RepID=UPI00053CADC1|nr:PREDICTED: WW domain-binding protein 1 [Haliaeetus leucocephalus]